VEKPLKSEEANLPEDAGIWSGPVVRRGAPLVAAEEWRLAL
jgi:hypothetical protein